VICNATKVNVDIFIFKIKMDYEGALTACENFGYNLIRIENEETKTFKFSLSKIFNMGKFWIDANDTKIEKKSVNPNRIKIRSSNFENKKQKNDNNEDCLAGNYNRTNKLSNVNCLLKNSVICFKKSTSSSKKTTIMSPQGTFVLSYETMTFDKARSFCEQEGLKLIKPRDMATNNMIFQLSMAYRIEKYWIEKDGLSSEMTFTTSKNNKITFQRGRKILSKAKHPECIYESNGINKYFRGQTQTRKIDPKTLRLGPPEKNYEIPIRESFWDFADCKAKYSVICG